MTRRSRSGTKKGPFPDWSKSAGNPNFAFFDRDGDGGENHHVDYHFNRRGLVRVQSGRRGCSDSTAGC